MSPLQRDEVYVCMGHFEPEHGHAHLLAGHGLLDGPRHTFGKHHEVGQLAVLHVEKIVHFLFRYDERVALYHRVDVEKGIEAVVFGTLVRRDFSCCNFTEKRPIFLF